MSTRVQTLNKARSVGFDFHYYKNRNLADRPTTEHSFSINAFLFPLVLENYRIIFDRDFSEIFRKKIPERGHGIAYKTQSKEAAIFSRRPGKHITIIDTLNGEIIEQFKSKIGRHFYGHGTYSENGLWLYASENEYDSGRGVS